MVGLGVVLGLLKYGTVPSFLVWSTVGCAMTSALILQLPQDTKSVSVHATPQSLFQMVRTGLAYLFREGELRWYTY